MKNLSKTEIINDVLENVREDMNNEEIIHLVLEQPVSKQSIESSSTFGQKTADHLAKIAGSWGFIIVFSLVIAVWISINMILNNAFDPYPFILLNLVLSCISAIQAPIIMMSQNRQEEKDREHSKNNYKVNLKTEIIIQDLHNKLDQIIENQEIILKDKK